jgi:hypothetical protein
MASEEYLQPSLPDDDQDGTSGPPPMLTSSMSKTISDKSRETGRLLRIERFIAEATYVLLIPFSLKIVMTECPFSGPRISSLPLWERVELGKAPSYPTFLSRLKLEWGLNHVSWKLCEESMEIDKHDGIKR